jgi:hypothetical protein
MSTSKSFSRATKPPQDLQGDDLYAHILQGTEGFKLEIDNKTSKRITSSHIEELLEHLEHETGLNYFDFLDTCTELNFNLDTGTIYLTLMDENDAPFEQSFEALVENLRSAQEQLYAFEKHQQKPRPSAARRILSWLGLNHG